MTKFTRGGRLVPMDRLERWVTFSTLGDAEVVSLTGEIDLANAPEIGRAIVERIESAAKVLIDLTTVSFLDSAGVRLLDALIGDLDKHGKPARLTLQLCAFRDDLLATDLDQAADDLSSESAYPGPP